MSANELPPLTESERQQVLAAAGRMNVTDLVGLTLMAAMLVKIRNPTSADGHSAEAIAICLRCAAETEALVKRATATGANP